MSRVELVIAIVVLVVVGVSVVFSHPYVGLYTAYSVTAECEMP